MYRIRDNDGNERKQVRFASLSIREFPVMMGDNPASSRGIPVTIGWDPIEEHADIAIDAYEGFRPVRREKDELKMESLDRVRMLKQEGVGYSRRDIQESIRQVDKERRKRQQTRSWMRLSPLEEAIETVERFVLHSVVFRSHHQKQRKHYVVPYQNPESKHRIEYLKKRERRLLTRKNTDLNESANKDNLSFDESKSTQATARSSVSMDESNDSKSRGRTRSMIEAMEEEANTTERTDGGMDE